MSNVGRTNNNYDPFASGGDSWFADDGEDVQSHAATGSPNSGDGSATPLILRSDWDAQLYVSNRPDRPTNLEEADSLLNHFGQLSQKGDIDYQTYCHLANAMREQGQFLRSQAPASAGIQDANTSSGPRAPLSTQADAQRAVAQGASPAAAAQAHGITHPADLAILNRIASLR